MKPKEPHTIRLDRDTHDYLLPKNFFVILAYRFFPVMGLIYFSSVIGLSYHKGDFFHYLFKETSPYLKSMLIVFWASIPSLTWIFLHETAVLRHVADLWYKIIAVLLVSVLATCYVMFPEIGMYGLRQYFAMSVPIFIIVYGLFVREWLPDVAVVPLNVIGGLTFMYGSLINFLY